MLQELIAADKYIFLYLNSLGSDAWDNFWLFLSHKLSALPLYMFLLIVSYKELKLKNLLVVLGCVIVLITVSDQLSQLFKYGLLRLRPCHDLEIMEQVRLVKNYCGGKYSYFSAHASNTFAIAIFFGLSLRAFSRKVLALLLVWASLVSYSRIYIGVHYPLDVISGAFIGSFLGWLFLKLYLFLDCKFFK